MQVIVEHLDALYSFVQNFTLFRNKKGSKIVKGIKLTVNLFLLQRKSYLSWYFAVPSDQIKLELQW